MSQTNEFAKANNPDYVYYDIQRTNIYNNSPDATPQLQFLESRDAPIVENSGDYTMSVTRFSVDTANLPVLVVEPDVAGTDPFDPNRSIHKVAIITEGANLKISSAGAVSTQTTFTATAADLETLLGWSVASSHDGEVIVYGEPFGTARRTFTTPTDIRVNGSHQRTTEDVITTLYATKRGHAYIGIRNAVGSYSIDRITDDVGIYGFTFETGTTSGTIASNWEVGVNVAVSGDGNIVLIGSGDECPYYWILNRITGITTRYNKPNWTTSTKYSVSCSLNYFGTYFVLGKPTQATAAGKVQIFSYNIDTRVVTSLFSNTGISVSSLRGRAVKMNDVGDIVVATRSTDNQGGGIDVYYTSDNWTNTSNTTLTPNPAILFYGFSVSMNNAGTLIAIGAKEHSVSGRVYVYTFTKSNGTLTLRDTISPGNSRDGAFLLFGSGVALNFDGTTIHIGMPEYSSWRGGVQTFQYSGSSWVYKAEILGTHPSETGRVVAPLQDTSYIAGCPSRIGDVNNPNIRGSVAVVKINIATNQNLPSNLVNMSSVANVNWISDNANLTPPVASQLDGTNTATFPYYHCHSYNNFIDVVNTAIKEAYVANFNELWHSWVSTLSVANADFIKAEFINIVARCFSTPPYMEWNSTLDASIYLNTLFSSIGNYYAPSRTYTTTGSSPNQTQVSTNGSPQPIHLRIAFNASLYSLFSSFPATETIIEGEKFYMLNMPKQVASLRDNSTISLRALPLIPDYPFLYEYHNAETGVLTLPYPDGSVLTYPLQDYFIVLKQEISTIDAWSPVSSIVFTSNQLPIVVSQFSASNSISNQVPSATIGNRFALVITDLMTNQQGFRPNIIYNPTAEYRRITLTGNMGIRNIDINVFWRSKTGQLLPFRLPSGGSATLKLLFEKKDKNTKKVVEPDVVDIMGGKMPKGRH
jgi:hypothetical protein